ncbi:MAG: ArsR family transcriptional regulator [Frankiales bacterium]|nr:ArsR family transcriptional regulator [Frankiales bacterium]
MRPGRAEESASLWLSRHVEPEQSSETGARVDNSAVLHALAEPRRIELLRLLTDQQLCTRDLVLATGMAQPLVSHHLRVLRQSMLVDSTVCANLRVYRVRAATLRVLGERLGVMARRAALTSDEPPC